MTAANVVGQVELKYILREFCVICPTLAADLKLREITYAPPQS